MLRWDKDEFGTPIPSSELTDEERITLKRLFKRSPLIKNSGINFRRELAVMDGGKW